MISITINTDTQNKSPSISDKHEYAFAPTSIMKQFNASKRLANITERKPRNEIEMVFLVTSTSEVSGRN